MPKVTVIIPVYNTEEYLTQCVESVLGQTFTDFEVWLIDDGSTDGSPALCDSFATKDPRVHALHQPNGGLSAARNAGLDRAAGDYIYFLDSDDYIFPNLLETAVRRMKEGYDMVFFGYETSFPDGQIQKSWARHGQFSFADDKERMAFFRTMLFHSNLPWQVWNILYDRRKIEETGLFFADNRIIFAEDLYFTTCSIAKADRILSIPDCLMRHQVRVDSLSGNYGSDLAHTTLRLGQMSANAKASLAWMEKAGGCDAILEKSHLMHYYFVRHELRRSDRLFRGIPAEKEREILLADLRKYGQEAFFARQMQALFANRRDLRGVGSVVSRRREPNLARYLIDGRTQRFLAVRMLCHAATGLWHIVRPLYEKCRRRK